MLIAAIAVGDQPKRKRTILPHELIVRGSTARP